MWDCRYRTFFLQKSTMEHYGSPLDSALNLAMPSYCISWIFLGLVYLHLLYRVFNCSRADSSILYANFFKALNLRELTRIISLVLSPIYLSLCLFYQDTATTTHLGAFTILLVWLNVTFTLGKFPSFGWYITIANYVGWEVVKLLALYSTSLIGT